MTMYSEPNISECPALPQGWYREVVPRMGGLSAGRHDVYYYSPLGQKVRSKPELIKLLGDQCDLTCFDFNAGRLDPNLAKKIAKEKKPKKSLDIRNNPSEESLVPPIRQTASIFKQPVTLVKNLESRVRHDVGAVGLDKHRQLFWEKRLAGLRPYEDDSKPVVLPGTIKSIAIGAGGDEKNVLLASVSTALHLSSAPVTGQVEDIEANPGVMINPRQPLIAGVTVSQEDIAAQQDRVNVARQKLADAIQALG